MQYPESDRQAIIFEMFDIAEHIVRCPETLYSTSYVQLHDIPADDVDIQIPTEGNDTPISILIHSSNKTRIDHYVVPPHALICLTTPLYDVESLQLHATYTTNKSLEVIHGTHSALGLNFTSDSSGKYLLGLGRLAFPEKMCEGQQLLRQARPPPVMSMLLAGWQRFAEVLRPPRKCRNWREEKAEWASATNSDCRVASVACVAWDEATGRICIADEVGRLHMLNFGQTPLE